MKAKVSIIDYGMGNLLSIERAFEKMGAEVSRVNSAEAIINAEKLVLPGVGAFPDGMNELAQRGFIEAIHEYAKSGRYLMGVCLGMQMLLDESEEIIPTKGLGLVPGKVVKLPLHQQDGSMNKIPHVAWAEVNVHNEKKWGQSILKNLENGSFMYFVHSYFAQPVDRNHVLATSPFGDVEFCSAVINNNVQGTQFHPEKSGDSGLKILRSFVEL